jgi:hypothetical protein
MPLLVRDERSDVLVARPQHIVDNASALGHAFAAAWRNRTPRTENDLRAAVVAFVQRSKADGLSPERVIVVLKSVIAAGAALPRLPSIVGSQRHEGSRGDAAYVLAFAWCLEAYFDGPSQGSHARAD